VERSLARAASCRHQTVVATRALTWRRRVRVIVLSVGWIAS
jgi:hypothetical protein